MFCLPRKHGFGVARQASCSNELKGTEARGATAAAAQGQNCGSTDGDGHNHGDEHNGHHGYDHGDEHNDGDNGELPGSGSRVPSHVAAALSIRELRRMRPPSRLRRWTPGWFVAVEHDSNRTSRQGTARCRRAVVKRRVLAAIASEPWTVGPALAALLTGRTRHRSCLNAEGTPSATAESDIGTGRKYSVAVQRGVTGFPHCHCHRATL